MEKPIMAAIGKLVLAGEKAGFTVEQMIQILQAGASVEGLLRMIEWRMYPPVIEPRASLWIM
jgi:hypothetical protein